MTREQKLAFHLEMVVCEAQPEGTRLNGKRIEELAAQATPEQKQAAYQRALVRCALPLDDEREP